MGEALELGDGLAATASLSTGGAGAAAPGRASSKQGAAVMHLGDFLGLAAGHPALQQQLAALPALPPHSRHCLLSGPERCGKTALLFSLALSAARQGKSVLLLCRRCAAAAHQPVVHTLMRSAAATIHASAAQWLVYALPVHCR